MSAVNVKPHKMRKKNVERKSMNEKHLRADAALLAASVLPFPSFSAYARVTIPVAARPKNEKVMSSRSVKVVAGLIAAKALVPAVRPTKMLSIFDNSGLER